MLYTVMLCNVIQDISKDLKSTPPKSQQTQTHALHIRHKFMKFLFKSKTYPRQILIHTLLYQKFFEMKWQTYRQEG